MVNLKKMASFFMAAAMTLSLAAMPAMADETEAAVAELEWDDSFLDALEEQGVTGSWYTFDDVAVAIWAPDVLISEELTEEDVDDGMIGYFAPEDGSAGASVMYLDADGMSLEEYEESLLEMEDVTDVESGILNGLNCVTYTSPEYDTLNAAFESDSGKLLLFSFAPASDEGFSSVASIMMLSIQPYEESETEA